METVPAELEDHLPPMECQIAEQPDAIEQEQAGELAESGEEDALSDTTLVDENFNDISETGDVRAPGLAGNLEPVEKELPAPVTTRSGRISKFPERFRDYICNEAENDLTQKLDESVGAQRTPELDVADYSKSSFFVATLGYLRRKARSFVQEQEKNKFDLRLDIEAMWNELLKQDITKGLNMEVGEKELLGESTACKTAVSPTTASINIKEQHIPATNILCKKIKRRKSCTRSHGYGLQDNHRQIKIF